jgi:hypothetical protein
MKYAKTIKAKIMNNLHLDHPLPLVWQSSPWWAAGNLGIILIQRVDLTSEPRQK